MKTKTKTARKGSRRVRRGLLSRLGEGGIAGLAQHLAFRPPRALAIMAGIAVVAAVVITVSATKAFPAAFNAPTAAPAGVTGSTAASSLTTPAPTPARGTAAAAPMTAITCPVPTTDAGTDTLTATVPATGTYYEWIRLLVPVAGDSLSTQFDTAACLKASDSAISTLSWVKAGGQVALSVGSHTLKLVGAGGVEADRVVLTTDVTCTPAGDGSNCLNVVTPTPTPVRGCVAPPSAIADGNSNAWWVAGGQIFINCKLAGFSAHVIDLVYVNGRIYQENDQHHWWYWNGGGWTATSDPNGGPVPTPTPPSAAPIRNAISGKCLDDWHSGANNGNPTDLYGCNGTGAQQWALQPSGTITNANGLCLTMSGSTSGSLAVVASCNGSSGQLWRVNPASQTIVNPGSGLCLDDQHSVQNDGNPIWLYGCNGTSAQKWSVQ